MPISKKEARARGRKRRLGNISSILSRPSATEVVLMRFRTRMLMPTTPKLARTIPWMRTVPIIPSSSSPNPARRGLRKILRMRIKLELPSHNPTGAASPRVPAGEMRMTLVIKISETTTAPTMATTTSRKSRRSSPGSRSRRWHRWTRRSMTRSL